MRLIILIRASLFMSCLFLTAHLVFQGPPARDGTEILGPDGSVVRQSYHTEYAYSLLTAAVLGRLALSRADPSVHA